MAIGKNAVLIAAIASLSGCNGSTATFPFAVFEPPRDDFTRRVLPEEDVPPSLEEEPEVTWFPAGERDG